MPQFEGGRAVKVKNTFIDVEESPKETDKRRSRSMPPPIFTEECEEEEESETLDQVSSPVSLHGTHYSEPRSLESLEAVLKHFTTYLSYSYKL